MSRSIWPWLVTGGAAAAILYFGTRAPDGRATDGEAASGDLGLRNANLSYRPIGASGRNGLIARRGRSVGNALRRWISLKPCRSSSVPCRYWNAAPCNHSWDY